MEFKEVLARRHSVRDYSQTQVPDEHVREVMSAAAAAPSAMNEQPWLFYVCRGESRARVGEIVAQATVHLSEYMSVLGPKGYEDAMHWYSSLGDAPVVIVATVLSTDDPFLCMNRALGMGAALENILMAATDLGLAGCNITFAHWVQQELCDYLGVEEGREVAAILTLGYPAATPPVAPEHRADVAVWLD